MPKSSLEKNKPASTGQTPSENLLTTPVTRRTAIGILFTLTACASQPKRAINFAPQVNVLEDKPVNENADELTGKAAADILIKELLSISKEAKEKGRLELKQIRRINDLKKRLPILLTDEQRLQIEEALDAIDKVAMDSLRRKAEECLEKKRERMSVGLKR